MSKFVNSSIYLAGAKTKLVEDILPHLQDGNRKILIEPFIGTGVLSLNALNRGLFEKTIGNDIEDWVVNLHNSLKDPSFILSSSNVNNFYSKDKEGYLKMREDYNNGGCKDNTLLFNLLMRSHSNRMRFSGKGSKVKCNIPYGDRCRFDMERMLNHHILTKGMTVTQGSFVSFISKLDKTLDWKEATVYIDSPYQTGGMSGGAVYNTGWSDRDDDALLEVVENLYSKGAKVLISNIFYNKGFTFQKLIDWSDKNKDSFEVYHLDRDYSNCSNFYWDGDKTDEVLIVSK